MGNGKKILMNTLLLTTASLLMRGIGMVFQVYLSRKIGPSGVGLFQLIMSIYFLFTTLAISGIRFAATRLISEELGKSGNGSVTGIVRKCLIYALIFGSAATVSLLALSDTIGMRWIKDTRAVLSLRVLAASLPFLAMTSVLSGYFTAVCRVIKSAAAQFAEQLTRIFIVWLVFSTHGTMRLELSCAVIMAGGAVGDLVSFVIQYTVYRFDRRRYSLPRETRGVTLRMLNIALPLALSSYARTALSTLQQLLVPLGFEKAGATAEKSLADYGIIHGMVMPVITFPSALFYSLAEIIVPELTEAQVCGRTEAIESLTGRILRLCTLFSFGVSAILFRYSSELGRALYGLDSVGTYIRLLSLLMPVMYLDSITDGMLRGLGQQLHSMWYNIADSLISLILVYTLLPKWAVKGYIFIICFTEIFNFALSIHRLSKVTKIKLNTPAIVKALFASLGSVNITMLLLRRVGLPLSPAPLSLALHIILTLLVYFALLLLFGCVEDADRRWAKSMIKSGKE